MWELKTKTHKIVSHKAKQNEQASFVKKIPLVGSDHKGVLLELKTARFCSGWNISSDRRE